MACRIVGILLLAIHLSAAASTPLRLAPGYQRSPAIAFDSTNFLVLWHGCSADIDGIHGAMVASADTLCSLSGWVIAQAARRQGQYGPSLEFPSLAYDGANFLVVWQYARSGNYEISGARMTPGGKVLDSSRIVISEEPLGSYPPALAFDGTSFLVVWTNDYRRPGSFSGIYGARVSPAGTVLDPSGFVISRAAATGEQEYPALGFDGTNFLVVWQDDRWRDSRDDARIYGARVSPDGTVLDP